MGESAMPDGADELQEQLLERDAIIAKLRELVQSLEGKNSALNNSLLAYIAENDLLKRRLFGTKSERTNTSEFQLLLEGLFAEDAALRKQLEQALAPRGQRRERRRRGREDRQRRQREEAAREAEGATRSIRIEPAEDHRRHRRSRAGEAGALDQAREHLRAHCVSGAAYACSRSEPRSTRSRLREQHRERALRPIVVGRKNWMFYGSDVHAESAAATFSIVASCRLHRVDVYDYLCDVQRGLPFWPRERLIELAPKSWAVTRTRLDADELARPVGIISVPTRTAA